MQCECCGYAFGHGGGGGNAQKTHAVARIAFVGLGSDCECPLQRYCSDECIEEHIGASVAKKVVKRIRQLDPKLGGGVELRKEGLVTRISLALRRIRFKGVTWKVKGEVSLLTQADLKIKTRISIRLELVSSTYPAYEVRTALVTDAKTLGTVMEDMRIVQRSGFDDTTDADELQEFDLYLLAGEVIQRFMQIAVKSKWLSYPLKVSVRTDNDGAIESLKFLGFRCKDPACTAVKGAVSMTLDSASQWWRPSSTDEGDGSEKLILQSIGKPLTASKAKEILRHGTVRGHKITPRQRRFFFWVAGGRRPRKSRRQRSRRSRSAIGEEISHQPRCCMMCQSSNVPLVYKVHGEGNDLFVCDSASCAEAYHNYYGITVEI